MRLRISTAHRGWARILPLFLALSLVAGPIASAMHEAHEAASQGALRYERHDEAAHHGHHAPGDHAQCALCTYHRSAHALAPSDPELFRAAAPQPDAPGLFVHHTADGSSRLPSSRAPPHLS